MKNSFFILVKVFLYTALLILVLGSCSQKFSRNNQFNEAFYLHDMGDSVQFGIAKEWKQTYHRGFSWLDVSYIIDSTQNILYLNDFGNEVQMINLANGKVLNAFKLDLYRRSMMPDSEIRLISNRIVFSSNTYLLLFDRSLNLKANLREILYGENAILDVSRNLLWEKTFTPDSVIVKVFYKELGKDDTDSLRIGFCIIDFK